MRRLANENSLVRAVLIGVLLLAFALVLYSRVLSQTDESESAPTEPVTPSAAAEAESPPAVAPTTAGATEPAGTQSVTPAPETAPADPPATGAIPPHALVPGKGLPAPVLKAYENGKTVALLVIKRRGIDDRKVRQAVEPITRRKDAAVFIVRAKHIARYSRITLGVNVSRVPALVAVGPRDGRDAPRASVSYGFRGTRSAIQAVRDALYEGGRVPYFPE